MWRKWVVVAVLAGVLAGIGAAQAKFLTNDDIIAMVKAGQSDDAVLTAIQGNGTDFDVSTKAVLLLKKSGVSKKVIDAMISAVKDQKDAAAAVITSAQQKIAAQEAEDKADEARAQAVRAQRAAAAGAVPTAPGTMGTAAPMGPMPGVPSVTMVQNGQKQPLGVAHTQIVPTNMPLNANQMQASSIGTSMNGLSNDATLGSNLGSLAKMFASSGGMPGIGGGMGLPIGGLPGGGGKGAAVASTLMMANPMLSGAMIAGSLLKHAAAAHAAAASASGSGASATPGMGMGLVPGQQGAGAAMGQSDMTAVWAIPGMKSETIVHGGQLVFEVQVDASAGVNPDEYEPVLIRLTPTQSNFRLVGATTINPNQMQSAEANWNLYSSFVEQRLPAQATKMGAGRYTLLTTGIGLPAGEYGIVLRPVSKDKKFSGSNVGQNVGDGLVFNCVWSFEVQ